MRLQILIPQYNETDDIIKPLLDSIALQQNVPFDEIGVIICNDGTAVHLSPSLLSSYPFKIEYHLEPHRGGIRYAQRLSGLRHSGLCDVLRCRRPLLQCMRPLDHLP